MNPWKRFCAWLDRLLNKQAIVRRASLIFTFWMTYEAFRWAYTFALASKFDGVGTAAVIGAVLTPLSALQGYVFNRYASGVPPREKTGV